MLRSILGFPHLWKPPFGSKLEIEEVLPQRSNMVEGVQSCGAAKDQNKGTNSGYSAAKVHAIACNDGE